MPEVHDLGDALPGMVAKPCYILYGGDTVELKRSHQRTVKIWDRFSINNGAFLTVQVYLYSRRASYVVRFIEIMRMKG